MPELPQISNPLEFFIFNGRAIGPQLHLILWGLGLLCIDFLIPKGKGRVGAFFAVGAGKIRCTLAAVDRINSIL